MRTGYDGLVIEILQEQAATIGRLAGDLRDALTALDAFDRRASDRLTRANLVEAAADALWKMVVQRECAGFRDPEPVLEDLVIPAEVRATMGARQDLGRRRRAAGSPWRRDWTCWSSPGNNRPGCSG